MKIKVEHLGYIHKGEVNLDRNLTVFIGKNQTGKTYLSNLIYIAYTRLMGITENYEKILEPYVRSLLDLNYCQINLVEFFAEHGNTINEDLSRRCSGANLSKLYGSAGISDPENTKSTIMYDYSKEQIIHNLNDDYIKRHLLNHSVFNINQDEQKQYILKLGLKDFFYRSFESLNKFKNGKLSKEDVLSSNLNQFLSLIIFPRTYFMVAERAALNQIYNRITEDRVYDALAYPIRKYLLDAPRRTKMPTHEAFIPILNYLEKDLIQGSVYQEDNGDFYFSTKNITGENLKLALSDTSSLVKTLAYFVTLIKHQLSPGNVLLIDEPEINLHPDNQYYLARVIAMLANAGVKVVVSTHSLTFLQELNNLMMLAQLEDSDVKKSLYTEFGYQPEMELNRETVRAYWFENHTIEALPMDEVGIVTENIDELLHRLNRATNKIYYQLTEQLDQLEGDEDERK